MAARARAVFFNFYSAKVGKLITVIIKFNAIFHRLEKVIIIIYSINLALGFTC